MHENTSVVLHGLEHKTVKGLEAVLSGKTSSDLVLRFNFKFNICRPVQKKNKTNLSNIVLLMMSWVCLLYLVDCKSSLWIETLTNCTEHLL